jgi:hypothetical protein
LIVSRWPCWFHEIREKPRSHQFLETPYLAASDEKRLLAIAFSSRHGVSMLPDIDRAAAPAHVTGSPGTPLCHLCKIETEAATFAPTARKNLVESLWILFSY